jgi:peptidoglycan/LPS O-acetylase OafA/YrhL
LDGLRAIAILLVIGCHYHAFASVLGGIFKFGWVGVDIFFVLSGFLITSILLRMKGSPNALRLFYTRRFQRILPPLAIALSLISVGCVLTGDLTFFTPTSLIRNVLFLQAFGGYRAFWSKLVAHQFASLAAGELPLAAGGLDGPLSASASVLWSLSIEEYFYLLWAPVVLYLSRRTVTFSAIAICAIEFFLRWMCFGGRADYFFVLYRFDALIYGALVALSMDTIRRHLPWIRVLLPTILAVSTAGLAILMLSLGPIVGREIRQSARFMVIGMPLISATVAALVALLALRTGSRGLACRALRLSPMAGLGTVSYTLYLVHVLFYLFVARVLGNGWYGALASFVLAVAFAAASWRLVEAPILAGTLRRPFRRRGTYGRT